MLIRQLRVALRERLDVVRLLRRHRAQGARGVYAYGYQLTATGVDPCITFQGFLNAYGGKDMVTLDGKLHVSGAQACQPRARPL